MKNNTRLRKNTSILTLLMYLIATGNVQAVADDELNRVNLDESTSIESGLNDDENVNVSIGCGEGNAEHSDENQNDDSNIKDEPVISEEHEEDLSDLITYDSTTSGAVVIDDAYENTAGELLNGDFSFDKMLEGWTVIESEEGVVSVKGWGYDGEDDGVLNIYSSNDYSFDINQTISGLENGVYEINAYGKMGGTYDSLNMYADNFGGDKETTEKVESSGFEMISITIEVTNGQVTIGFSGEGKAEAWANFDKVTLTKIENANDEESDNIIKIENSDFEDSLNGWHTSGNTDAIKIAWSDDRKGYVLNYWKEDEYTANTYQTITGLNKGKYVLSAFVNSGGYNDLYMYTENPGAEKVKKEIDSSDNFTMVTLEFEVTDENGQVTIGFYGDGQAKAWANFDDVLLKKVNEDDNKGKITNPEFQYNLDGWESTGDAEIAIYNSEYGNNNTKGCLNYKWYTGEKPEYETDTHQTVTGLENGTYIVKAYVSTSGPLDPDNKEGFYMYAKDFDAENSDSIVKEYITDAHNFRLTFFEVEVTNNQMTIGFHAKGLRADTEKGIGEWSNFDSVSITKKEDDKRPNLDVINNYSFSNNLSDWKVTGNASAAQIDKTTGYNSKEKGDSSSLKFTSSKSYEVRTEQTITNLENGHYKFEFYAKSSGGQNRIYGYAKNSGQSEAKTSVPVDENFRKVVVDFEVTNGQATVGFYSNSPKDGWSNFDDVKLYKVNEAYKMLKGGDLTELNYVEDVGGVFYDENGNARDPFHILAENGFNFARLRVYNETGRDNSHIYYDENGNKESEYYLPDGYQNKEDMLKLAKRSKEVNMEIELSLHYSDWWTNGLTHDIPREWQEAIEGMNDEQAIAKLEELVYEFTKDVMQSLKDQETLPEYISLGNEMQGGLLYPYGKVDDMEILAKFLNAGARAVREVSKDTKIILHLDEAGDNNRYYKLLDGCDEYNVDYDIIGPSYYPFWTRNSVEQIIPWCNDIYAKYGKKIMFMETGYNWNPTMYNSDLVGQLKDNGNESHESTPQGQKEFMDELFNGMRNADDNCIIGDLYWDPILINNPNVGWAMEKGDAQDGSEDKVGDNVVANTTLFDFQGKALKSLKSYSDNTEGTIYGMVSGIVVDKNGKVIENANVTININGEVYNKVTDKYGRFFLNQLKESDNGKVTISKSGYVKENTEFTVEADEVSEIKVVLKKSSSSSSGSSSNSNKNDNKSDEEGTVTENKTEIDKNTTTEADNQWIKEGDNWCLVDDNGDKITGWAMVNNEWYYLNNTGVMETGWIQDNNTWYYLNDNGSMKTGWVQDNNTWYYLNDNGSMKTGWVQDNNTWYYLNDNGSMKTGWVKDSDTWYYLNDNGSMKTGWIKDNNKWYYLDASGKMSTNTIVDGYKINDQGELI